MAAADGATGYISKQTIFFNIFYTFFKVWMTFKLHLLLLLNKKVRHEHELPSIV